jgi:hypothetical protein
MYTSLRLARAYALLVLVASCQQEKEVASRSETLRVDAVARLHPI